MTPTFKLLREVAAGNDTFLNGERFRAVILRTDEDGGPYVADIYEAPTAEMADAAALSVYPTATVVTDFSEILCG